MPTLAARITPSPCPARPFGGDIDVASFEQREPWRNRWRNDGGFGPHAFDPAAHPELFQGVLTRRFFAFLIDLVVLAIPIVLGVIFIALFGLLTLGLGWLLFWLVSPLSVIWAILYYGLSLGGPHSATVGMRVMDLQLRTWTGEPGYFRAGSGSRSALLDFRLGADAVHRPDRPVQPPPAASARPRARNRDHQHLGASAYLAAGAARLTMRLNWRG